MSHACLYGMLPNALKLHENVAYMHGALIAQCTRYHACMTMVATELCMGMLHACFALYGCVACYAWYHRHLLLAKLVPARSR